jgi:outer membrane protein OmpA-like peptidoglycan-associated protein
MAKIILLSFLFSLLLIRAFPQLNPEKELDRGFHVVVGSFKIQENAKRYSENLSKNGMTASYSFNTERELYYVSIGSYETLDPAVEEVTRVRQDSAFYDAWIKRIGDNVPAALPLRDNDLPALTIRPMDSTATESEEKIVQSERITLENTEVFLSLFNATNNRVIEGKVDIVDAKNNKLITQVDGNKYLKLPATVKGSEKLILICEITGYRKIQLEINYQNPLEQKDNPGIELFGTTVLVNFEMVPYTKGDIITLYNVYFYNDASIMQPESQYELNQVVQMMQDNPQQRIRLHGHTNGNYTGKIISMGADKNYFSLLTAENHFGTARELAEQRASIIREFLIDNHIEKDRIEIKAWGGKRPLFDKHSARAKLNVRVEVEVL